MFGAVVAAFEHASTACEPSHRRRGLASEHQARSDQKCVPGGALRIVAPDGFVVSARPRARGFLVVTGQVRGEREPLEIIQLERCLGVRRRKLPVRVAP